jgi:hypothetical protein
MTSTAAKMTDTLFENGDDKRARLKLKPNYLDHLKGQVHPKMQQSFKLLGTSNAVFVHQRAKKSHTNAEIKRSGIFAPNGKRNSPEEVRVSAALAENNPPPKKKPKKNPSPVITINNKVEQFLKQYPPANGTHYDLRELVVGLLENSASPVFKCSIRKLHDSLQKLQKIVCTGKTLQRWCKSYIDDAVLPRASDDGAAMRRCSLIAVENIPKLNEMALEVVGIADLHSRALEYATTVESYLNNNNIFFPTVDSDNEKLDGCYLTLDTVRGDLIRSGFAEQGLGLRWKEYLRASHLTDRNTAKDRPQYQFYPRASVGDDEAPNRRGTVCQLQQKLAMGMRKCDVERIMRLFNWTEIDEAMLTQLSYRIEGGGSLASKKYKHVCFMFELFFAVAL